MGTKFERRNELPTLHPQGIIESAPAHIKLTVLEELGGAHFVRWPRRTGRSVTLARAGWFLSADGGLLFIESRHRSQL